MSPSHAALPVESLPIYKLFAANIMRLRIFFSANYIGYNGDAKSSAS